MKPFDFIPFAENLLELAHAAKAATAAEDANTILRAEKQADRATIDRLNAAVSRLATGHNTACEERDRLERENGELRDQARLDGEFALEHVNGWTRLRQHLTPEEALDERPLVDRIEAVMLERNRMLVAPKLATVQWTEGGPVLVREGAPVFRPLSTRDVVGVDELRVQPPDVGPIMWNPSNLVVQDHRDGTVIQPDTDKERAKRGLPPFAPEKPSGESLECRIKHAINCVSAENGSDTPDFILARYLTSALAAFDVAVVARDDWYGGKPRPAEAQIAAADAPPLPIVSMTLPEASQPLQRRLI